MPDCPIRAEHSSRAKSYKRLINKTIVKDGRIFYIEELSPFSATARKSNGKTCNISAWARHKTALIFQPPSLSLSLI
jgi:hypothetical protein